MYTDYNFRSKRALKQAIKEGQYIRVYSPSGLFPVNDGPAVIEGPQYPEPHKFYARVHIVDGVIDKFIS